MLAPIWVGWTDFWVGIPAMEHDVSAGTLTACSVSRVDRQLPRRTQGALMRRTARGSCTRRSSTTNTKYWIQLEQGSCRQTKRNVRGTCRNKQATKVVNKHPSSVNWQQGVHKTTMMYLSAWKHCIRMSIKKKGGKKCVFAFGWRSNDKHGW